MHQQPTNPWPTAKPWEHCFFFGRYGPRRLRLQLSVPTKLIETNKHKKTAVKQRSELLNYLLQHADFVSSGCSATRRKFLSATQQK